MATKHTTWQGAATQSNKAEQKRVSKKYKGIKKIGVDSSKADSNDDPFQDQDPLLDGLDLGRTHKLDQYTRASGLSKTKAKKILTETGTLQK
jgi:hypothetical protein